MPCVQWKRWLDDGQGPAPMFGMPAANVADRGDNFRRHAEAVAKLVSGDVACDKPEVRGKCVGLAARPRIGQLSDSLDLAA